MMRIFLGLILMLSASLHSYSQTLADSLRGVTLISTDKLGNCYAVLQSEVIKLDPQGRKLNNFSRKDFGPISQVDSRDPLRVHLFYRDFGMVSVLDNQMGETSTLDLRAAGLIDPVVIANAVDGGLWVYERLNNQLLKYDDRVQKQLLAIDMFQFSGKPLNPVIMKASDNWLVLATEIEIYIFDRFGSYARMVPIKKKSAVLKIEDQLLWYSDSESIIGLNLRVNTETRAAYPVQTEIQQLEITPANYWILSPTGTILRIPVK
jgi:hypothetical protein